ncbi:unnamed protein product [Amoebophrya sp. A25]|nr:unnamed protein product [Amoebophrya sp. A25]|eukprot:GSA25T00000574001.1
MSNNRTTLGGSSSGQQLFRVDNGLLRAQVSGLAYRSAPSDSMQHQTARIAKWNTIVKGVPAVLDDDSLSPRKTVSRSSADDNINRGEANEYIFLPEENLYLPRTLYGVQVLVPIGSDIPSSAPDHRLSN